MMDVIFTIVVVLVVVGGMLWWVLRETPEGVSLHLPMERYTAKTAFLPWGVMVFIIVCLVSSTVMGG